MNSDSLHTRSLQKIMSCLLAVLSLSAFAVAQEQKLPDEPKVKKPGNYVFKPIEISPAADEESYKGRFLFINKENKPVNISGFDVPLNGKFVPRFVRFQTLKDGVWTEIQMGYCGTAPMDFPMASNTSYEFHIDLPYSDEHETPVRVGLLEYWSEPFVLEWKKDRESGRFANARKELMQQLRKSFADVGFKEEFLVGDDFHTKLLQSIMKKTSAPEAATSFSPFAGKLNITPNIDLNGTIRIDFSSDEVRDYNQQYTGWFSLDPKKFKPQWFHKAAKVHSSASKWGDGIQMELDDGESFESALYFKIIYEPFDKGKIPDEKAAKALLTEMLKVIGEHLKE